MRDYEVVYIFRSSLSNEDVDARLASHHAKILSGTGSEVTAVEHWGKRQLAYPIDRHDNGYYVVAQFTAEPEVLPEFERALKLDEDLLRHLVVLSEGELPIPSSLADAEEEEEEEDDEDDDERRPSGRRGRDERGRRHGASDDEDGDQGEED